MDRSSCSRDREVIRRLNMRGWIGVDLDGTLAKYDGWQGGKTHRRADWADGKKGSKWLTEGKNVKIFTARMSKNRNGVEKIIKRWCKQHIGRELEVTNVKDFGMIELWDDRAV